MLIVGAKGFAKEVLDTIDVNEEILFYDDVENSGPSLLYGKFKVLKSIGEAKRHFNESSPYFTIGIGNPLLREKMLENFVSVGGIVKSTISPKAIIGSYDVKIGIGSNILPNAVISSSTTIGKCCIIYYNVVITHDSKVGDFVELSPGATLLGRCKIGDLSNIGANATILPDVIVGRNVTIGAGAVVNRDIPDNAVAVGIPARVIKAK